MADLVADGRQIKKQKLSASVAAATAAATTDDGAGTISIGVKLVVFVHYKLNRSRRCYCNKNSQG